MKLRDTAVVALLSGFFGTAAAAQEETSFPTPQIDFGETELREQVKSAGDYWNPGKKAWMLSYHKVLRMGLERRVIDEFECL